MMLREEGTIATFQARQRERHPWVMPDRPADTSFRVAPGAAR
jgi:hypothetical protein